MRNQYLLLLMRYFVCKIIFCKDIRKHLLPRRKHKICIFFGVLNLSSYLITIQLFELRISYGIKIPCIDGPLIGHKIHNDRQANRMVPS